MNGEALRTLAAIERRVLWLAVRIVALVIATRVPAGGIGMLSTGGGAGRVLSGRAGTCAAKAPVASGIARKNAYLMASAPR